MENNSKAPKRRGRPAGSKNKNNREAITNPSESMEGDDMVMGSYLNILEVAAGCDVIAAVYDFANRHQVEVVSVISTHGIVRNLTVYNPNMPPQTPPFITCNSVYKLLSLKGNFYGSCSSIRPPPPFSARHIASFISFEGNLYGGIVQGKLTAATNVFLGVCSITGTDFIKLPLSPPRALPDSQLFFDLNEGMATATVGLPGFSSGVGRSRTAYGVPTTSSPSPLISWNPMTNNFSYIFFSKDSDRSIAKRSLD